MRGLDGGNVRDLCGGGVNQPAFVNTFFHYLRVGFIGFCMGLADLIPGVSGGTIAFVGGIYERLIHGLKALNVANARLLLTGPRALFFARVPMPFFIVLGAAMLVAIFFFAGVIAYLLEAHPTPLWAFFFGLILASVALLGHETWRWAPREWGAFVVATVLTFLLVGSPLLQTSDAQWWLFPAGVIAISAMMLPGISGSYLLLILGKYEQVLTAVRDRDAVPLLLFGAGIVCGVLLFVRVIGWLLKHYRRLTLIALTGVMTGALRTVWPWRSTPETGDDPVSARGDMILPAFDETLLLPALTFVCGLAAVGILHLIRKAERSQNGG